MKNNENPLINEVDNLLKRFATTLSKPQIVHFEQITKGMLFSELKSINSYSKSSNKDQSSLNRFMNSKAVNNSQINQLLISEIESKLDSNKELDFIFDDTIKHHKYGKQIYGIGRHHDHLEKGYSTGHSLVTGGLRQNNTFYPTNCELYQRKADVSETSAFKTKIEIAQAMLDEWLDRVDNVLMDSWYCAQEILKKISKKGKIFFTMLKKDRNLKIGRKKVRQVQEWIKYIDPRKYRVIEIGKQFHRVYETIGYLPKVGKVKVLFTCFYNPLTKKSKDIHYLCTNNLELSAKQILIKYQDRWPIETFHRDIKQNLGFEKCILRKEVGIKRHFLMQFIAHNLLVFSKSKQVSCGEIQRELKFSFLENVLQNYGLSDHNLEGCKNELKILC